MLTFRKLYTYTYELQRLPTATSSNLGSRDYVRVGDVEVAIQPLASEVQAVDQGLSKKFTGFVAYDTDIRENDRLVDGDNVFTVQAVNRHHGVALNHIELILVKV